MVMKYSVVVVVEEIQWSVGPHKTAGVLGQGVREFSRVQVGRSQAGLKPVEGRVI